VPNCEAAAVHMGTSTISRTWRRLGGALALAVAIASPLQVSPALAKEECCPRLSAESRFTWPATGPITSYFGEVDWTSPRGHSGLDIGAPMGAPVRAMAKGQVVMATRSGDGYGIKVVIDHGRGLHTLYAHLSQLNVEEGERVRRGEVIGLVGSTGFSTGPHLHFEVLQDDVLRDPLAYLP
jgi:murein DD-endopeptidase MepM/ murein hydrolase activator NlpD